MRNKLESLGIRPNPVFGQNFVVDSDLLEREVAYADVQPSDSVLEIGPGIGNLTGQLLKRTGSVTVIEYDRQFSIPLESLQKRHNSLQIIWGDALDVRLPEFDKVVANLPYRIALPILFKILERRFISAVFIVQLRLARRIAAQVGQPGYCRAGVAIGRRSRFELIEEIRPNSFFPEPEVTSAIVRMERIQSRFQIPSEIFFKETLEKLFIHRDETVQNAIELDKKRFFPSNMLTGLSAKIKNKIVHAVTPAEFGFIAEMCWDKRSCKGLKKGQTRA
ncbi:MAG: 16S rRNA (adenine(1518)-N(6)/adenine(1519)-N(6))-dimethyltransferase RsmA [Candidatus Latescibacterota bacterium]|nr:16S rRNA (adenine(1518)-N(6)/adenine(1519)-N(6))-dimethyltransferase RsmA [Candidatus Latescibacterota bacterium]